MLVDPPLRYHLPQESWIRLNRAIEDIPYIRTEFVDWLEYGLSDLVPECKILDLDYIQVDGGGLSLYVDGSGPLLPPLTAEHPSELLYRQISQCVDHARRQASMALYAMIANDDAQVYARKHEHDADLQLVPPYVWEMTAQRRDLRSASACLPSGKYYYDIHLCLEHTKSSARSDGLSPSHGAFVDWFADRIEASPYQKTMKTAEGPGSEVYEKASEFGVPKSKVEELKGIAYQRFSKEIVDVWRKAGRPAGNPPNLRRVK